MISIRDLTICQGAFRLERISFHVPAGQYAVLMGKTGSGKTTLLETICGLRPIRAGSISLCGQDVTAMRPAQRGVGYVPQDGALFSTFTVKEHLAFALRLRKWNEQQIQRRVKELAELLEIEPLLERRPHGLSGGEIQRVALGRAISFSPSVLLLDEPLSALDEKARHQMYEVLRRIKQHTGVTALHVTHSRHEAESLGDWRLVMHKGRVETVTQSSPL